MNKYILIAGFLLTTAFSSCGLNNVYYKRSKSKSVRLKSYPNEELLIRNFAIYNSREEESLIPNNEPFFIDKDSLSKVVFNSFRKLESIPLKISYGENKIDSIHYKKPVIRIRKIKDKYLNELVGNSNDQAILVPIVYAKNIFAFTGFISSGGISGSSGFYFMTWLNLIVYIVKDDQIIYSQQFTYKSDQVWADSREEILAVPPLAAVKQEHWDELVRLAMKDYIKRLK